MSEKTSGTKKGFSRRHETAEEHQKAHETYLNEHGREARQRKADERQSIRDTRTPQEQLRILDERLGVGRGAKQERARLQALIK